MPVSCHFRNCKALLVTGLTHVSGAIASVHTFTVTFTFTFTLYLHYWACFDAAAVKNTESEPEAETVDKPENEENGELDEEVKVSSYM